MLPLEKFKEIVASISVREETEEITSPGGSSRFGNMAMKGVVRKPVEKVPFIERLLMANGFAIEGHPRYPVEEVFRTDDPAISVSGSKGKEFRNYVSEEILTMDCGEHHTIVVELDKSGSELLGTSLFKTLHGERRLEDALVRIAHAALRGYEKQNAIDSKTGAQQHETLCVVGIRDDKKGDGEEAPYLVCFATKYRDRYSKEESLVHFLLKQECVDWEPQLRDTHLTQIYEGYFSRLTTDDWQRAFITSEEWKAATDVFDIFEKKEGIERIRGALEELLERVATNFPLTESSENKARLTFTREKEHTIGVDSTDLLKEHFTNPIEATIVRDNEQHLLGYIMYCMDSQEEAERLRKKLKTFNCFNNVLLIAPDSDGDLSLEIWDGDKSLRDKLVKTGTEENGKAKLISTLSRFLVVSQSELESAERVAVELARRAQYLRAFALQELRREQREYVEDGALLGLYRAFNDALAKQTEEQFADAYAQTVTYALFAARWLSRHANRRFRLADAEQYLPTTSPFLASLATKLLNMDRSSRVRWLLEDITSLLERIDVESVFESDNTSDALRSDPVIHFYEPFLDAYDKTIRDERGVYYTPDEVVSAMVNLTDDLVKTRFELPLGLASDKRWRDYAVERGIDIPEGVAPEEFVVQVLDPATGTGTFLKRIIGVIYERMMSYWEDEGWNESARRSKWQNYVRESLLPRLHGFEIMMAPYVICHLRLELALEETGFEFETSDRVRVLLTDTLTQQIPGQQDLVLGDALAKEAEEANRVKNQTPITVLVGNPPYDREEKQDDGRHFGGWIRDGWTGWRQGQPPLEDFAKPVRNAGSGGHLKNIYNLYVYFWRWSMWKALDQHPDIPAVVTLITAASYLKADSRGDAFLGMRESIRRQFESVYVLDLEGEGRGARKSANVFNIITPVTITAGYAGPKRQPDVPATAFYKKVEGTRDDKLEFANRTRNIDGIEWILGAADWHSSFYGKSSSNYHDFVRLTDIFPWQQSGVKAGRTWPIACQEQLLARRWKKLIEAPAGERRAVLFKNSPTGQKAHKTTVRLPPFKGRDKAVNELTPSDPIPPIARYSFRSFDRQWILADNRFLDRAGPDLWGTHTEKQIYLTSMLSDVLGQGPAVTISPYLPDLHHFSGRGGKDIIPLWRDANSTEPNITNGLLLHLTRSFEKSPTALELLAYVYAVLAHHGYTNRFREELSEPGPRVPITKNATLFFRAVELGRRLIQLHTYGERMCATKLQLDGRAYIKLPISEETLNYPESFSYNESTESLCVGSGVIEKVAPEIYNFSVSGLHVVKSWLDYRKKAGAGETSSPLDDLRPERWTPEMTQELLELLWVLEATIALGSTQQELFEEILAGDVFTERELPSPTDEEKARPRIKRVQQPTKSAQAQLFAP